MKLQSTLFPLLMLTAAACTHGPSPVQSYSPPACSSIDDCAAGAYGKLKSNLNDNYWQLGNVFDTLTDYLFTFQKTDSGLATTALDKYNATKSTSTCWYDDYAWWGIASSKAFDDRYASIFAGTRRSFQKIALDTWNTMHVGKGDGVHLGAPNVWTNKDNQSMFNPPPGPPVPANYTYPPRFPNGVWQYDIFYNARPSPQPHQWNWDGPPECNGLTNPSNPANIKLGPFQNTVVNGLYFVLALRLNALAPNMPGTGQAAENEYSFLKAWFGPPPLYWLPARACTDCARCGCTNDLSLLRLYDSNTALIGERVSTYGAEAETTYPKVNGWDKDTFWAGDQGLILSGLIDYLKLQPGDATSSTVAKMITNGVRAKMVDPTTGGIAPYLPIGRAPEDDTDDYKSGSGVFMRYLLYAAQQPNSPIANLVAGADFQGFLKKSAQAAICAQNTNQDPDMFDSFNVLATLTAAKQLLRDQNMTGSCQ